MTDKEIFEASISDRETFDCITEIEILENIMKTEKKLTKKEIREKIKQSIINISFEGPTIAKHLDILGTLEMLMKAYKPQYFYEMQMEIKKVVKHLIENAKSESEKKDYKEIENEIIKDLQEKERIAISNNNQILSKMQKRTQQKCEDAFHTVSNMFEQYIKMSLELEKRQELKIENRKIIPAMLIETDKNKPGTIFYNHSIYEILTSKI
jgi:hypothetical protein